MGETHNALDEAALKRETLAWLEIAANTPGFGTDMNVWSELSRRVQKLCDTASNVPSARTDRFADGVEAAAKLAEAAGEPYKLNTNTGAMMYRAVTEKLAKQIRALSSHSGESKEEGRSYEDLARRKMSTCRKCGSCTVQIDEQQPDGSFAPGDLYRCINCKVVPPVKAGGE